MLGSVQFSEIDEGLAQMTYQQIETIDVPTRGVRPTILFGYVIVSLSIAITLWGSIFSYSITTLGLEPAEVASAALGFEQQTDDSMLFASDTDLQFIAPAAGPERGCE